MPSRKNPALDVFVHVGKFTYHPPKGPGMPAGVDLAVEMVGDESRLLAEFAIKVSGEVLVAHLESKVSGEVLVAHLESVDLDAEEPAETPDFEWSGHGHLGKTSVTPALEGKDTKATTTLMVTSESAQELLELCTFRAHCGSAGRSKVRIKLERHQTKFAE